MKFLCFATLMFVIMHRKTAQPKPRQQSWINMSIIPRLALVAKGKTNLIAFKCSDANVVFLSLALQIILRRSVTFPVSLCGYIRRQNANESPRQLHHRDIIKPVVPIASKESSKSLPAIRKSVIRQSQNLPYILACHA